METPNQVEKDATVSTNPKDIAGESSATERELTDQEIASVAALIRYRPPIVTVKRPKSVIPFLTD